MPVDGVAEQENYSLRPENFHLPRDDINYLNALNAVELDGGSYVLRAEIDDYGAITVDPDGAVQDLA